MATIDDIARQKMAIVAILDQKIVDGMQKMNAATSDVEDLQLHQAVHELMEKRYQLFTQAYEADLSSPQMKEALDALTAATDGMKKAADRMTATQFSGWLADLLGAADRAMGLAVGIHNCSAVPTHSYYDWQLKNLQKNQQGNYLCRLDGTIVS